MYPRINYEMTEEDLRDIMDACKPTLVMKIGSYTGSSPQENANRAWQSLGEKMGFDHMTVRPIQGKGDQFFSAVPSETKEQKKKRIERETRERNYKEINKLEDEIRARQDRLIILKGS